MRYSKLFGKTLRSVHHDVKSKSYAFLLRGGFIRPLGHGLFMYMPMGMRVLRNVIALIRHEMENLGGQEVRIPVVTPLDIWKKSGRDERIGRELATFRDRTGKYMAISPSHEEAMVELVRNGIRSYRDLPLILYQFQDKFRDEERIKHGLLLAKEFMMKDAYSFHRSASDLNNFFPKIFQTYLRIFEKCGLSVFSAESGVGYRGGQKAYEFLAPSQVGEDVIVRCESCGYSANRNVAVAVKDHDSSPPLPMEPVDTPGKSTIEELSSFLGLPRKMIAKTMLYKTVDGFVMAVVRGDYEVSIDKLNAVLDSPVLRQANEKEISTFGFPAGYLSPLTEHNLPLVVDDLIANSSNLVMGGNQPDIHYRNTNFGRDYSSEDIHDISQIRGDERCKICGARLGRIDAIELGNIFKLGDSYTRSMRLFFQEESGRKLYPHMGSYCIGIGRLINAIAANGMDKRGLVWPLQIAPYKFYLMGIGKSRSVLNFVETLYNEMEEDTLLDDRSESAGVKFKDADLLGIPYRIVVSAKHLKEQKIEIRDRKTGETSMYTMEEAHEFIKKIRRNTQDL